MTTGPDGDLWYAGNAAGHIGRIDPETRDIVQDIYIREVKEVDGELYNVEFTKYEKIRDPNGRLARLLKAKRSDAEIIDELMMVALGRLPSDKERQAIVDHGVGVLVHRQQRGGPLDLPVQRMPGRHHQVEDRHQHERHDGEAADG